MKESTNIKKCFIKYELKFDDYKNCLEANQLENAKKVKKSEVSL